MSKHTAVFVFDEELKTIVIESVDGVRYVPEVEVNPYAKYVGKWIRYTYNRKLPQYNKWFFVVNCLKQRTSQQPFVLTIKQFESKKNHTTVGVEAFDLTDARDTDPDEKTTVTTAHSSLVIREDQTPDYKHLVGKWVKCIYDNMNEWVQILGSSEDENCLRVSPIESKISGIVMKSFHVEYLEINNPKDYKPHPIPAEIMEGLLLLPTDHPEYGNIRRKAILCAEQYGESEYSKIEHENIIVKSLHWFRWSDGNSWPSIIELAESGAFDPKPVEERIPFNIKEWQRREYLRIETRIGKRVSHLNNMEATNYPLVGLVEGHTLMNFWNLEGNHSESLGDCALDLFLVINKQK